MFLSRSSRARSITSALAVRQMLNLQIGISKRASVYCRVFGEELWGKKEIGCVLQGDCYYCAHHVGDNLFQLYWYSRYSLHLCSQFEHQDLALGRVSQTGHSLMQCTV